MHEHTGGDGASGDRTASEPTDGRASRSLAQSRRSFLKTAAAAGVVTGGLAAGSFGTASAGIPTPWLSRDGNLVTDESGNQVVLRGLNIADPRRINATAPARGMNTEQVIDLATNESKGWHSRTIRLTCHPGDIAGEPPVPVADWRYPPPGVFSQSELEAYCENHLDPAVDRCEEQGVYAIVDYHRHWGSGSLQWNNPDLSDEVIKFWDFVAARYADRSHVIFEMYNEPTSPNMGATPIVNDWSAGIWQDWIDVCQPWVDTIRSHADNLTLIGSPMWSQYPEGALVEEPDGGNLGYTYHIYPGHSISDTGDWDGTIQNGDDQNNGEGVYECWKEVPLFVTEFGWSPDSSYPGIGTTADFGDPFFDWLADKPIHWTAWCFDPIWLPAMMERPFETGDSTDAIGDPYSGTIPTYCDSLPCEWTPKGGEYAGERVREALIAFKDQDLPGSGSGTPTDTPTDTPTPYPPTEDTPTPECAEPAAPAWSDGTTPRDVDGDGVYEDFNENCEFDSDDVVTYFQQIDRDGIQTNPSYYDANGNGNADFDDIVTLFQQL